MTSALADSYIILTADETLGLHSGDVVEAVPAETAGPHQQLDVIETRFDGRKVIGRIYASTARKLS